MVVSYFDINLNSFKTYVTCCDLGYKTYQAGVRHCNVSFSMSKLVHVAMTHVSRTNSKVCVISCDVDFDSSMLVYVAMLSDLMVPRRLQLAVIKVTMAMKLK